MTDERFGELVNLYLDREISDEDLRELQRELDASPVRKEDFEVRCRLHRALRMALSPGRDMRSGVSSWSTRNEASAVRLIAISSTAVGTGLAAAVVLAATVFTASVRDSVREGPVGQEVTVVHSAENLDLGRVETLRGSPADGGRSDGPRQVSLTAQLRLAGLGPETEPLAPETKSVPRRKVMSSPLAQQLPAFIDGSELSGASRSAGSQDVWPEGFGATLVNY